MAIEVQLQDVSCKLSDFKVCKECGSLNWYENESCINSDCSSSTFNEDKNAVYEKYAQEWIFWQDDEGYTEKEADRVFYIV